MTRHNFGVRYFVDENYFECFKVILNTESVNFIHLLKFVGQAVD